MIGSFQSAVFFIEGCISVAMAFGTSQSMTLAKTSFVSRTVGGHTIMLSHRRLPTPLIVELGTFRPSRVFDIRGGSQAESAGVSLPQINLTTALDLALLGNVSVGTPPVTYTLWFMMCGLTDLPWLIENGTEIWRPGKPHKTQYYFANRSSTYTSTGKPFHRTFAIGHEAWDIFTIAGTSIRGNQSFGLANEIQWFGLIPADGALGIDPLRGSEREPPTFPWTIRDEIPQPVMTLWFERQPFIVRDEENAAITFGGTDAVHCSDEWLYVPRDGFADPGGWSVKLVRVVIDDGNSSVEIKSSRGNHADIIGDSRSVLAPSSALRRIAKIAGATWDLKYSSGYSIPCKKAEQEMPTFRFDLSNELSITMTPEDYTFQQPYEEECTFAFGDSKIKGYWQLGQRFLNNHCVAYDYGQEQKLGFAKHRDVLGA